MNKAVDVTKQSYRHLGRGGLVDSKKECVRFRRYHGYGVRCILDAAKIVYCFGQVTSVTDDLS